MYKIATDKFGHVTSTAAVTKTDITALGIPATDTNTTYTFQGASNGFKVTPSNGEPQKVLIGKPATAGSADNATQVKNSLIVTLNSGSNEGTTKFTFNGSAKKTVNITPGSIGAATSAQGTKADNAVPEVTFTSSSLNVSAVKDNESKKLL